MPAVMRRTATGAYLLVHSCDVCGSAISPFGYCVDGEPSRWYCRDHRNAGEAFLVAIKQQRQERHS